jgi:hypothetical protein
MRFLVNVPLIAMAIAAYNALALGGGFFESGSLVASFLLPSGAEVFVTAGDLFVAGGLIALFVEIVKAARIGAATVADHMMSTAAFIVALVEFLLVPFCGTAAFFLLTAMALIDVVAGYSVSIFAARRDFTVDGG